MAVVGEEEEMEVGEEEEEEEGGFEAVDRIRTTCTVILHQHPRHPHHLHQTWTEELGKTSTEEKVDMKEGVAMEEEEEEEE